MPDLERHAVLDWLRLAEPATTALGTGLVRPIEVTEAVEPLLVGLGQRLDSYPDPSSAASLLAAGDLAPLREVLAQLGIARTGRMVAWLGRLDLHRVRLPRRGICISVGSRRPALPVCGTSLWRVWFRSF